ncbi:MAG: VWA domain-containing protein, partial [Erysipelothrix sp.]|nr:VWA domain-containing protein [Erysipelothrix sp.]
MNKVIRFISKLGLVLIMLLSAFVIGTPENVHALAADPTDSNRVTVDKEAKLVDGKVNTWDITLDVKSLNKQSTETTNVVLVLDVSGSMSNYMNSLKSAASLFVNTFLNDPNVRIGLVTFETNPFLHNAGGSGNRYATTSAQKQTLLTTINNLSTGLWTHTQGGIHDGMLTLDNGPDADNDIMILFSDGEPNRRYSGTDPNYSYPSHINDSTNSSSSSSNAFTAGKHAATLAKNKGYEIFSIGFNVNSTTRTFLQDVSSGAGTHYHAATAGNLGTVFANLAGQISTDYGIENAQVVDIVAPGFTVIGALNATVGTATQVGNTITWNIGRMDGAGIKNATLTYRVEINDSILNVTPDPDGKLYPTNTSAILKDLEKAGFSRTFPVPKVDPVFIKVSKSLVDQDNNTIVDTDRVFDVELKHTSIYTAYTSIKAGQTVILTSLRDIANGYKVTETGSNDGLINDAEFSDYTIKYTINGVVTDLFNVVKSTSVISSMDDILIGIENKYTIPTTSITAEKLWSGGDPASR